ncbi:hypothetical protein NX059_002019 [Plenodomus lindquistii]|nr:hypothetical protein NX059_002019 [Plenodomus lindquistii]
MSPDYSSLDCTHIDRLLGRVMDLPTEGNQRNSRRNLLVIRRWMVAEGPGVVLLEILGQLYWRLGELNSKQFERFKNILQQQQSYVSMLQNADATMLVVQRIKHIQRSKADACQDFLCELSESKDAKVDSHTFDAEFLRANSGSPFACSSARSAERGSSQELGPTGLIKSWPLGSFGKENIEQSLIEFYMTGICPGRTIATQSNVYVTLLQTADACLSTRYAILSLSAAYIRDYLPGDNDAYHEAELCYSTQALNTLAAQIRNGENYQGALATSMLLMHHGAINQEDSRLCWSCHANIVDAIPAGLVDQHSDAALVIRTQIILARSAQISLGLRATSYHSFERVSWLAGTSSTEAQKICGALGLCPQLVFLISSINAIASRSSPPGNVPEARKIESLVKDLEQWTSEPQSQQEGVLLATAECFRLATMIYLQCRLYG